MTPSEPTVELADRIVVAASRNWVRGVEPWRASVRSLSRYFAPAQGRIFAFHLGALLAVLASAGNERIVMGPVASPQLWPGEAVLLDAIALCRGGFKTGVDTLLARYLGPAARRLAVYHLHGVVASLGTVAAGEAAADTIRVEADSAIVVRFPVEQAQQG